MKCDPTCYGLITILLTRDRFPIHSIGNNMEHATAIAAVLIALTAGGFSIWLVFRVGIRKPADGSIVEMPDVEAIRMQEHCKLTDHSHPLTRDASHCEKDGSLKPFDSAEVNTSQTGFQPLLATNQIDSTVSPPEAALIQSTTFESPPDNQKSKRKKHRRKNQQEQQKTKHADAPALKTVAQLPVLTPERLQRLSNSELTRLGFEANNAYHLDHEFRWSLTNDLLQQRMAGVHDIFLKQIPSHGSILSCRDTKLFIGRGFKVRDYDLVKAMADTDVKPTVVFDGIWACDYFQELSEAKVEKMFAKFMACLRLHGVMYLNYKIQSDFDHISWDLESWLVSRPEFRSLKSWTSGEADTVQTVNVMLRKTRITPI